MNKGYVILRGTIDRETFNEDINGGIEAASNMTLATPKVFTSKEKAIKEMVKIRRQEYFDITDENDGWANQYDDVEYEQRSDTEIEIDVYADGDITYIIYFQVEEVEF